MVSEEFLEAGHLRSFGLPAAHFGPALPVLPEMAVRSQFAF
jgi:hypothetical protein